MTTSNSVGGHVKMLLEDEFVEIVGLNTIVMPFSVRYFESSTDFSTYTWANKRLRT